MNIIITMAGNSSRFYKAGYNIPKFMIEVSGKTVFEWSLSSLKNIVSPDDNFIFVANDKLNVEDFILEKCNSLSFHNIKILKLSKVTDGQATTALLALDLLKNRTEPILIYNIDTLVLPKWLLRSDISSHGWIPYFEAEGDHWSFVELNEDQNIIQIEEKKRISNKATIGLYYFTTAELFKKAYTYIYSNNSIEYHEKYIAPLYKYLIKNGHTIKGKKVPLSGIFPLGTPIELEIFKKININESDLY